MCSNASQMSPFAVSRAALLFELMCGAACTGAEEDPGHNLRPYSMDACGVEGGEKKRADTWLE